MERDLECEDERDDDEDGEPTEVFLVDDLVEPDDDFEIDVEDLPDDLELIN